ncbi:MAG: hypothetical protein VX613_05690 [Candidatus Thermoplasmatota archaeon]|nr:hypothetical protein [Candidatus Thermoplasmatota archaeon]
MGDIETSNNSNIGKITLISILKDLLAKERRSHIMTIVIIAPLLYVFSQGNIITASQSSIAFISFMIGYGLTALLGLNENTRKYLEKNILKSETSGKKSKKQKLFEKFISTLKIISIPLIVSGTIFLILSALIGEKGLISEIGEILPIILASLFIFWSVSQALSYKNSVGLWIDDKIKIDENISTVTIKKNSIIQLVIVGITATILSTTMLSLLGDGEGLNSTYGVPIVVIITLISQGLILRYSQDSRLELIKRKDGEKIDLYWGIALHIFASWHLLSVYRRFVSDEMLSFNLFEEVILMIFTVVMSIWSISSKGMPNYKLFIPQNVLFWGIAFGFGYAGSVTMLAVGLEGDISSIFGIGHLVTWFALLAMHKQSCKDFVTSRL